VYEVVISLLYLKLLNILDSGKSGPGFEKCFTLQIISIYLNFRYSVQHQGIYD
jgi:hypothetical protein